MCCMHAGHQLPQAAFYGISLMHVLVSCAVWNMLTTMYACWDSCVLHWAAKALLAKGSSNTCDMINNRDMQ